MSLDAVSTYLSKNWNVGCHLRQVASSARSNKSLHLTICKKGEIMEKLTPDAIAQLLGGAGVFGAAALALIGVVIANGIGRRMKEQELFQNALKFLTGGTQRRSVGIAILKVHLTRNARVVVDVFRGQMHYLEQGGHDKPDTPNKIEHYNYKLMKEVVDAWDKVAAKPRGGW